MDPTELAAVYDAVGDFVTIYLDTTSDVENAAPILELRWKNVLRELEQAGVEQATRDALSAARGQHWQGGTRVLVAAEGRVLLATSLPGPPATEAVHVGALPQLLPLLDRLSLQLPHLVVLADREGADIVAYAAGNAAEPAETGTVTGAAPDITKVHAGGWSERRYQARAQEGWQHNAKDVAGLVDTIAKDVEPWLIVAAGDVRALGLVHDNLPERLQPLWHEVPGGRSADGSAADVARHVDEALGAQVASATIELLERFSEERGRSERASDGVAETTAALRRAQVDLLLLTQDLLTARNNEQTVAWFGLEATAIGLDPAAVSDLGTGQPRQAPLSDVLVRTALSTGARVTVVPGGMDQSPKEGVGALLRYSTPRAAAASR